MKFLEYFMVRTFLFLFFVLIFLPFIFGIGWLSKYSESHHGPEFLSYIVWFLGLAWLLCIGWMVHETSKNIVFGKMTFGQSLILLIHTARVNLSFLPLIGHWFVRPRDNREWDEDREDK